MVRITSYNVCYTKLLRIVIADEPTAHLDSALSWEFMAMMQRLKDEGKTLIIASHDPIARNNFV